MSSNATYEDLAYFGTRNIIALPQRRNLMQLITGSKKIKSRTKSTQKRPFDAQAFLDSTGIARKIAEFSKKATIYAQGDPAKTVMYIQEGSVKLTVVNDVGKEAVVAVLGPSDFF